MPNRLELIALPDIPLVHPGDDLTDLIAAGLERAGEELEDGDVLVIAQKIVSKSEGRYAELADVEPSALAIELGEKTDKDTLYWIDEDISSIEVKKLMIKNEGKFFDSTDQDSINLQTEGFDNTDEGVLDQPDYSNATTFKIKREGNLIEDLV